MEILTFWNGVGAMLGFIGLGIGFDIAFNDGDSIQGIIRTFKSKNKDSDSEYYDRD
jgi:hypothetical protein